MQNNIYTQKFNSSKKYTPSTVEIKTLKADINRFIPIAKYFIKTHNVDNKADLKEAISYFMDIAFKKITDSKYIDSRLYELHAIEDILKDPTIIDKHINEIQDTPNTHSLYTHNGARSRRLVLVNALDEIRKLEEFAKENSITANTKMQNIVIQAENPKIIKDAIKLAIKMLNKKTMRDKLILMLNEQKEQDEDYIKNNQIDSLNSLYDFLKMLGFTRGYLAAYNTTKNKYGFSELDYAHSIDNENNLMSIEEVFSREYLEKLSYRELCFLNAFWSNRFTKDCARLNSAFTAINSLDLWNGILKGKTEFNISDEEAAAVLQKANFITGLMRDTFHILQQNIHSAELKQGTSFDGNVTQDYSAYYTKINNAIKNDYNTYFKDKCLISNNFLDDVSFSAPFVNLEMYVYHKKNTTLEPLIKNTLDNNNCKNWGLIRDELDDGILFDSLSAKRPMVLLGFDVEGFNMPFRFHISKDRLMELAKYSNSSYIVPEYQGNEDFLAYNITEQKLEIVPTNIMMPIPKEHRKIIIEKSNSNIQNKNLWEHFYFLMNGTFPKHLTQTVQKNKKQSVTTRLPIIYTDLKTGKRFIKEKNKYIDIADENAR